jgi:hypothetical protein
MTTDGRITDLAQLLDLFESIENSMYRLETLQAYHVAYERARFEAFLAGDRIDLTPGPWQQLIRKHHRAGRAAQRVHVVLEPLSDYLRYELATTYRRNLAAGEVVGIIPTSGCRWPPAVPSRDYWLFDDRDLWAMDYDFQGRFVVAEQTRDDTSVQNAVRGKWAALTAAIPLDAYLAARPTSLAGRT